MLWQHIKTAYIKIHNFLKEYFTIQWIGTLRVLAFIILIKNIT